jgi:hypothetical protein
VHELPEISITKLTVNDLRVGIVAFTGRRYRPPDPHIRLLRTWRRLSARNAARCRHAPTAGMSCADARCRATEDQNSCPR